MNRFLLLLFSFLSFGMLLCPSSVWSRSSPCNDVFFQEGNDNCASCVRANTHCWDQECWFEPQIGERKRYFGCRWFPNGSVRDGKKCRLMVDKSPGPDWVVNTDMCDISDGLSLCSRAPDHTTCVIENLSEMRRIRIVLGAGNRRDDKKRFTGQYHLAITNTYEMISRQQFNPAAIELDFNSEEEVTRLERLNGRVAEIIFDWSTVKFINDAFPWDSFVALLEPGGVFIIDQTLYSTVFIDTNSQDALRGSSKYRTAAIQSLVFRRDPYEVWLDTIDINISFLERRLSGVDVHLFNCRGRDYPIRVNAEDPREKNVQQIKKFIAIKKKQDNRNLINHEDECSRVWF